MSRKRDVFVSEASWFGGRAFLVDGAAIIDDRREGESSISGNVYTESENSVGCWVVC